MSSTVYPTLPGLIWPVKRTPIWATKTRRSVTRREWRQTSMTYPQYRYVLQYDLLRAAAAYGEFQSLFGLFNSMRGAFDTFLFSDPTDGTASAQTFGTGDGVTTQFQLARTLGGFSEPVFVVNGTPQIYKSGVLQGSGYSISSTGLVTFTTAPANGAALTWSGSFYWRCHFEDDSLEFEQFVQNFWKTGQVKILTDKA